MIGECQIKDDINTYIYLKRLKENKKEKVRKHKEIEKI